MESEIMDGMNDFEWESSWVKKWPMEKKVELQVAIRDHMCHL